MEFKPVDANLDLVAMEHQIQSQWRENNIIERVADLRSDGDPWIFYEGPPTANGKPGLHHVWARAFKDLFPRFQTMRGKWVPRKGGWDCHGLPVELEVEKALDLHSKREIEAFGIGEFNKQCRQSVVRYVDDWKALTERAGVWIDTDDAYWTLDNTYIESVWSLIRTMWDRGLLYEGHRVVPYCGRCGTALSSHEVAQGYKDVEDQSVYVRFPVSEGSDTVRGADLVVWTTTPWTLLSNTAAAVGADIDYVRIKTGNDGPQASRDLIMAAAAHHRLFPEATVVAKFSGHDLVGTRYTRLFNDVDVAHITKDGWRVVSADFVSTEDGSGIVHIAPAFGADDAAVAMAEDLPVINPVNEKAEFDDSVARFANRFVKDVDQEIINDLRESGQLIEQVPYVHSYPHCWRCSTPLVYWAKTSWFARTSNRREDLVAQNETVSWHPEHIKHGRFGRWLEGNIDWALSRDRYWGTPLPIWRCSNGHDTCIGSVEQLAERAGTDLSDLDLHRPAVDAISIVCDHDGCDAQAQRIEPVLDAWFDSGSMPTAQHHFPFEAEVDFDRVYPADFICEAIDQTRGWFYSLLAVNTLALDRAPYRNVVCLGHIVDEDGAKMSKSKGNIIDPWTIFDSVGADALRWYFFAAGQPWSPRRVFTDGINETTRRTLLTVWNCVSFFTTYANLDQWVPDLPLGHAPASAHILDRWILGELDRCTEEVTERLENFDALGATESLSRFVDDLSNWYIRRSRPRFWNTKDSSAHATLHHCLTVTSQLFAPFCPHFADAIWHACTAIVEGAPPSVHLTDWPTPQASYDAKAAQRMDAVRRLVGLGRAARSDASVKVRQPLRCAYVLFDGVELDETLRAEIADELNVSAIEQVDTLTGLLSWSLLPNFSKLGPRLGKQVNEIKQALASADGNLLRDELDATGTITIAGVVLQADEVELRATSHEAFALHEENGWAVALDLVLDDELRRAGLSREFIRAFNEERKRLDLAISDRVQIAVVIDADDLVAAFDHDHDLIAAETLAVDLNRVAELDEAPTVEIGGQAVKVRIVKV